jgi:deoxyribonuclease V
MGYLRRFRPDPALRPLMEEWRRVQEELASRVRIVPLRPLPRFVAGVDVAISRDGGSMLSAAVIWDRELRAPIETAHGEAPLVHPYIPGYLGFREGPAVLAAIRALRHPFGAILFDGMGAAHPRRCGIATQLAVTLDMPGIGVGKSRLFGTHREPGPLAGDAEPLMDGPEQIGWVLRTRDRVRPVYVSVGHRADLDSALDLAKGCLAGYRLPEPTRLADREVAAYKVRAGSYFSGGTQSEGVSA